MDINAVGIMGANTTGTGAAELLVKNGLQVRLYDDFKDSLGIAMAKIAWSLQKAGRPELMSNIEGVQDLDKFEGADLIVEAASKSPEERRAHYLKLQPHIAPGCVIAARCGVRPLKELLDACELPAERVLGFHFIKPVRENQLVELARTDRTGDEQLEAAAALLRRIGKTPVLVKDNPGLIVERLARPFIISAMHLLESGKGCPHEIDDAFKAVAGAQTGPFEAADFVGLDTDLAAAESLYAALGRPARLEPSPVQRRLVQYGQLGRKSTIGLYIYEEGRVVGENPILPNIVKYLGLKSASKEEIFGDIMRPVLEEARILASEIMASEYDIETAAKLSFGWPRGPFGYARESGELLQKKKAASDFDKLDTF